MAKWKLSINHDCDADVAIPATLTYNEAPMNVIITKTPTDYGTPSAWDTEIGTPIRREDIQTRFEDVQSGYTIYKVSSCTIDIRPCPEPTPSGNTFDIQPQSKSVDSASGTFNLSVLSNTSWRITVPNGSFATVNTTAGTNSANVTVSYSENADTANTRTVILTAQTTDGQITKTLTITQKKAASPQPVVTYVLVVTPSEATIDANGTVQLIATYYTITDGVSDTGVVVTNSCNWSASNTYATVSNGLVTGNNESTTEDRNVIVTAEYSGKTDTANITVKKSGTQPEISYRLEIYAVPDAIDWNGKSQLYANYITVIDGTDAETTAISPSEVQWTVTQNSNYADVDSNGLLTADNDTSLNRTVKVMGTYNDCESTEISISVSKHSSSTTRYELSVTPESSQMESAATLQLTATYLTYADGSETPTSSEDVTSACTWETDKPNVANVSSAGTVLSDNQTYLEQVVTITARYGGYSDTASITVAPKEGEAPQYYYTLVVLPSTGTLEYNKEMGLVAKLYTYENGNPSPVAERIVTTSATWSSDNQYVGVNNGLVHSYNYRNNDEVATITATFSGYSGAAIITALSYDANIIVDDRPIESECSDDRVFTRSITANESGLTWKVEVVDTDHLGQVVDWVIVSPMSGIGSGNITITIVGDNTDKIRRKCYVRAYYPVEGNLYKEIEVKQYPTPRFNASSTTITAPQLGSTERITFDTNYPLTYNNNGNSWISLSQSSVTDGYRLNIETDENETNSARTGSVTVGSEYSGTCATFNPVTITVNQEYTPSGTPVEHGVVYLALDESGATSGSLTYNIAAAAQDIEFFFISNADCVIISDQMTCSGETHSGLSITETNGLELSGGTIISATGLSNRRKLIAHVPVNNSIGYGYQRTYSVIFRPTNNQQSIAVLTINQNHNSYYYSGYTMMVLFDQSLNDDVTISSAAQYLKPLVYVEGTRVYTAGYTTTSRVEDYIDNTGGPHVDGNKMTLSASSTLIVVDDGTHGYSATIDNPYEIYVPAYQTLATDTHDSARTFDLTFTYIGEGSTGSVSKTIHLHQLWSEKPAVPVELHMLAGSGNTPVDTASYTATTSGLGRFIHLQTTSDFLQLTGETGSIVRVWVFPEGATAPTAMANYITVTGSGVTVDQGGFYAEYEMPGPIGSLKIENVAPLGTSYTLRIEGLKTGYETKILTLDVTVGTTSNIGDIGDQSGTGTGGNDSGGTSTSGDTGGNSGGGSGTGGGDVGESGEGGNGSGYHHEDDEGGGGTNNPNPDDEDHDDETGN